MKPNLTYMYEQHSIPIPKKKDRYECPECRKKLNVMHNGQREIIIKQTGKLFQAGKKPTQWRYRGYGYFCTMTCATRFANRVIETQIIKP